MTALAYVFPGQGSQAVGMLVDFGPAVKETFAEASSVLGYDLWRLVAEGPEDQLNQTEFTQPAVLTASIAIYRLARERGLPPPNVVAGHSLGEYSALVVAQVVQFNDAVALVQQRGRYMQKAVPISKGSMAAVIGLSDEKVREVCAAESRDEIVQAANYNAPGQVVIAGYAAAVERAIDACKEAGARRAVLLPVSAPFHSILMQSAAENMAVALESVYFSAAEVPIIQNVDAAAHRDPLEIKDNLVAQICGAVLWSDTITTLSSLGIETLIECGPGKVLSGLTKRIDRSIISHPIQSWESINETCKALRS